jgi:hypothetical protein
MGNETAKNLARLAAVDGARPDLGLTVRAGAVAGCNEGPAVRAHAAFIH